VAGFLTTYLRTESLVSATVWAAAAALISVGIVAVWDRRPR